MAAAILHAEGLVERVLVVDLDAHQGNGTAATIRHWPWASILDVYEDDLFPTIKQPEDFPIPIPAGLEGPEYLAIVEEALPRALDAVEPDLVIYNAGSDPLAGDPLARLRLSREDLARRDLLVATMVRERGIPLAMVLSGGYARESWRVHADGIEAILRASAHRIQPGRRRHEPDPRSLIPVMSPRLARCRANTDGKPARELGASFLAVGFPLPVELEPFFRLAATLPGRRAGWPSAPTRPPWHTHRPRRRPRRGYPDNTHSSRASARRRG